MWLSAVACILSLTAFLGGLRLMRSGLEGMASGKLQTLLQKLVRTPTRGIVTGTLITSVLQSSAAVTAMTVGMVAGGSLAFRDALGVVLGANVGSTVTPQLLTLNLWAIVIPALFVGILGFISRKPKYRQGSMALVGFASIFIALQSLERALEPLTHTDWFTATIQAGAANPWTAALAGCLTSALIQSSTATTVITMAMAADHLIPIPSAICIVLGANVGTCATSIIAAIGQSKSAQRVALAHVLLNVFGVVATIPFIAGFTTMTGWFSVEPSQQIANAQTLFNVLCTLFVWPVTRPFAKFVERLLPNQRYA